MQKISLKQSAIEDRRFKVFELKLKGLNHFQIAKALGVSLRTIEGDLAAIK